MEPLQEKAGRIADRIHAHIAARGRTIPARVTDVSPLPGQGYVWATTGTSTIKLYARTLDDVRDGDYCFVRKMTQDRTSFWIYDSWGYRILPDGSVQYQPTLSPNA